MPATVLLVDDEPRVLDSLEALLAMEHRVLRADRPEIALERLRGHDVAVVVSDQRMPGMTGTELLTRCREVAPDAVRILLTAFTDTDTLMESINAAGIYHFLLKPWEPTELRHVVGRAVEHRRLSREREVLLGDLAAKNAELERALARLRDAQDDLIREASVRTQLQRYVRPGWSTWRSPIPGSWSCRVTGARRPCSSPTSAASPASPSPPRPRW